MWMVEERRKKKKKLKKIFTEKKKKGNDLFGRGGGQQQPQNTHYIRTSFVPGSLDHSGYVFKITHDSCGDNSSKTGVFLTGGTTPWRPQRVFYRLLKSLPLGKGTVFRFWS